VFSPRLFSNKREANSEVVATKVETVMNDANLILPKKTLDMDPHVVNQEFSDKKGTEGLAGEVVGQQPPILMMGRNVRHELQVKVVLDVEDSSEH